MKIRDLFFVFLLLLGGVFPARAQSYGDPIVNMTFGAGAGKFAGALPAGTTSYTYTAADFPSDGYYTVSNGISNNIWHNITDHTGDSGGYMMVVNASTSISDHFFKTTVTDLCPNTTYLFGAWVINLLKSQDNSLPNLTFTIESTSGTVLGTMQTGGIPLSSSPLWRQFTMTFTTPANISSVVLRIRNNKVGAMPGNDLALDDITFSAYGPQIDAGFNSADSKVTTVNLCEGESAAYTLNATVSAGYATPRFQWQQNRDDAGWQDIAGETLSSYYLNLSNAAAGKYQYRLAVGEEGNFASGNCRIYSDPLTLNVNALPVATISSNSPVCAGQSLLLQASGGASYSWTGPNGFTSALQNPEIKNVSAAMSGNYTVLISNTSGCSVTKNITISVGTLPDVSAEGDATICEGQSTPLNATGGTSFKWTPSEGLSDPYIANPMASPLTTTRYVVEVSDASALCPGFDSVVVTVINPPVVDAGNTVKTIVGLPVELKGTVSGADYSYYWEPAENLSDPFVLHPVATLDQTTTFILYAVSNQGCAQVKDSVQVLVYDELQIPNIFSPNGDGVNDSWNIVGLEAYAKARLSVFNRYGTLVHSAYPYRTAWDGTHQGTLLVAGVYYYVIDLADGNPPISGWVMISR